MKRSILWFTAVMALALPAMAQAPSLASEAQRAYIAGDYETARQKFKQIVAQDPQNRTAINYLKMIAAAEPKNGAAASMEKHLQTLLVSVDFKDATFEAALDYLKQQASKASSGKLEPSFVLQPGVNRNSPITLHLSNTPFTEVIRYMGDLANVQFAVERYAITVRPK